MTRSDWKPALLLSLTSALLLFAVLTLVGPWLRHRFGGPPLPDRPLPEKAVSVDLWVGELAPGVKGVLTSVFNDPGPDAEQDDQLNRGLGLEGGGALAFYKFYVFNTSSQTVTIHLRDGDLTITREGGETLPMRSLKGILSAAGGHAPPSPAVVAVLNALGSNRESIEVPPGRQAAPFIAFPKRVALGDAVSVARLDGTPFKKRPILRQAWDELVTSPSFADLKGL